MSETFDEECARRKRELEHMAGRPLTYEEALLAMLATGPTGYVPPGAHDPKALAISLMEPELRARLAEAMGPFVPGDENPT